MPLDPSIQKWYEKYDLLPPTVDDHGTEEEIAKNLVPIKPHRWVLEGNKLIGYSERGTFAQYIPTGYILTGTDKEGMPILKKI